MEIEQKPIRTARHLGVLRRENGTQMTVLADLRIMLP